MYAFLKHLYGENDSVLVSTMNGIEYAPHTDPNWDPFSIVYNVRTTRSPQAISKLTGTGARACQRQLGELRRASRQQILGIGSENENPTQWHVAQ